MSFHCYIVISTAVFCINALNTDYIFIFISMSIRSFVHSFIHSNLMQIDISSVPSYTRILGKINRYIMFPKGSELAAALSLTSYDSLDTIFPLAYYSVLEMLHCNARFYLLYRILEFKTEAVKTTTMKVIIPFGTTIDAYQQRLANSGFKALISNFVQLKLCDVIIHPCPNFR